MKCIPRALVFMVGLALLGAASFKAFQLQPVDEASTQADFQSFRDSLTTAVKNKDVNALMNLVDPNIKVGFGGEDGAAAFRQRWELDKNPAQSPLWQRLARILELGGAFQNDTFVAPFVFAKWPKDYSPEEYGVITGKNVNIRSRPAADAPVVKQSSYDIVRFIFDSFAAPPTTTINGETWPWAKVALPNGSEGYVWAKFFHSGLDYRAGFRKIGNDWKMIYFVAGD